MDKKIVLIGNPNAGKSIVFNYLSGLYVEVSNFPGTTVDVHQCRLGEAVVFDTPGIYGASSFSEDERVARSLILEAEVVVDVGGCCPHGAGPLPHLATHRHGPSYCGGTAIFVTHSREEAMVMGDVIAVMNQGRWEQVDTPQRIFHAPATRFVASFMGIADFLPAHLSDGTLHTELGPTPLPKGVTTENHIGVMVRPDDVILLPLESGQGVIIECTFQGAFYLYRVALPSGSVVHCLSSHTEDHPVGTRVDVRLNGGHPPICFVDGRAYFDGINGES